MVICFDIDGTLCTQEKDYTRASPNHEAIRTVNSAYDAGHIIKIFTARGACSGVDYTNLTAQQLDSWGVKFHELIMGKKPHFDILVDDKAVNVADWLKVHSILVHRA